MSSEVLSSSSFPSFTAGFRCALVSGLELTDKGKRFRLFFHARRPAAARRLLVESPNPNSQAPKPSLQIIIIITASFHYFSITKLSSSPSTSHLLSQHPTKHLQPLHQPSFLRITFPDPRKTSIHESHKSPRCNPLINRSRESQILTWSHDTRS